MKEIDEGKARRVVGGLQGAGVALLGEAVDVVGQTVGGEHGHDDKHEQAVCGKVDEQNGGAKGGGTAKD